jgi:hypothetical protein
MPRGVAALVAAAGSAQHNPSQAANPAAATAACQATDDLILFSQIYGALDAQTAASAQEVTEFECQMESFDEEDEEGEEEEEEEEEEGD